MKLSFYWWERISIAGLRELGAERWPFPPKVYDVRWLGRS